MRHDYDLPPDWHDKTDAEKAQWYTQERCRRQTITQRTAASRRLSKQETRHERKLKSQGFVGLKTNR